MNKSQKCNSWWMKNAEDEIHLESGGKCLEYCNTAVIWKHSVNIRNLKKTFSDLHLKTFPSGSISKHFLILLLTYLLRKHFRYLHLKTFFGTWTSKHFLSFFGTWTWKPFRYLHLKAFLRICIWKKFPGLRVNIDSWDSMTRRDTRMAMWSRKIAHKTTTYQNI